jgi:hypothetical protein
MKALEVSIDGKALGTFVPPEGASFAAMVGNIPRAYMRAQVMSANDTESWHWQLPDVKEGETISFRMIEAPPGSGIPPESVQQREPEEVAETKRRAKEAFAEALKEREAEDQDHKEWVWDGGLFMTEYEHVAMNFFDLVVLYILRALAKTANYFDVGPQWLRQFEIGKSTLY